MDLSIIILAERQSTGTQFGRPPALRLIAGWHSLRFVLESARSLEPRRLAIVGGPEVQRECEKLDERIQCIPQADRLGSAGACQLAEAAIAGCAETVLVLFGDTPLVRADMLRRVVSHHLAAGAVLTLAGAVPEVRSAAEATPQGETVSFFCFRDAWLWSALAMVREAAEEIGLMGLAATAEAQRQRVERVALADAFDVMRVDDGVKLALAHSEMRRRINERWMLAGVTFVDPATTYVDAGVEIGTETVVWPNTILQGKTQIGQGCSIGPGAVIRDSTLGERCRAELSVLEGAVMEEGSNIGPFSHLRQGAHLGTGAHVGNFGELKNSFLGPGAKMGHFSYLGDATVGAEANIAAGTITCNFDGQRKHPTVIGERAFIGSDTMLVAPVTVGEGAKTGAGAVVTHDVPPGAVVVGVPARPMRPAEPDK